MIEENPRPSRKRVALSFVHVALVAPGTAVLAALLPTVFRTYVFGGMSLVMCAVLLALSAPIALGRRTGGPQRDQFGVLIRNDPYVVFGPKARVAHAVISIALVAAIAWLAYELLAHGTTKL